MLLNISCSAVTSISVTLTFDDESVKKRLISIGDIVDITFNYNGVRKSTIAKVLSISANGCDPRNWVILLDASDDFGAVQYRISPVYILDVEIIKEEATTKYIESPANYSNIVGLKILDGQLYYTQDRINWYPIKINVDNIIDDENINNNEGEVVDPGISNENG